MKARKTIELALQPDYSRESNLQRRHNGCVAGVDEAGRGPLAGPVVAAAVILDASCIPAGINDSKALSRTQRERLAAQIMQCADVGIGFASVETIDSINILQATLYAMQQAIAALPRPPASALIDGRERPRLECEVETLIGGDALSLSIAAASIIAKVTRDKLMRELACRYAGYGWDHNMGYATLEHRQALTRLGPTKEHRRSFAPVRDVVALWE
ncbi:MAG: ribonuclease HII [Chitinophagales bacterium]|nr:ribonuclease HII [Hyphomicrobiales bacterium]